MMTTMELSILKNLHIAHQQEYIFESFSPENQRKRHKQVVIFKVLKQFQVILTQTLLTQFGQFKHFRLDRSVKSQHFRVQRCERN